MKVEITQIRKTIIDIGPNNGEDIEEIVLDKYNKLTNDDFCDAYTEMYYKPLKVEASDLNVKYRILDVAYWIIDYCTKNLDGIQLFKLNTILYIIYEEYKKRGIEIFDQDFITYSYYPKSKQVNSKFYMYVAEPIYLFNEEIIKLDLDDEIEIKNIIDKYYDIEFYDVRDVLKNTIYEQMVRVERLNLPIDV